jgi:polysaccharide biosynthesis/export protein
VSFAARNICRSMFSLTVSKGPDEAAGRHAAVNHKLANGWQDAAIVAWEPSNSMSRRLRLRAIAALFIGAFALALTACGSGPSEYEEANAVSPVNTPGPDYLIGPGDNLQIFVWRNPELTSTVPVRPDGRISVPLVEDMPAVGKTPTILARDIEQVLKQYVQEPIVNVIVTGFVGPFGQQIRVVGEAAKPQAIAFRANMSLLDVMIDVGGLTRFAAGNRAVIVRKVEGKDQEQRVRLDDLIKDGDVSANVRVLPGDILIIPQSYF